MASPETKDKDQKFDKLAVTLIRMLLALGRNVMIAVASISLHHHHHPNRSKLPNTQ